MPESTNQQPLIRGIIMTLGLAALLTAGVVYGQPGMETPRGEGERGVIASARELGSAFTAVAEQVSPSVVSVRVEARLPERVSPLPFGLQMPGDDGVAQGAASGVVIRPDGYILTNNHVVEHAVRIEVRLQDGRVFDARVVGTDPATDLAVLRIDARGLRPVRFADASQVRPGAWAIAIGSPFGLDYSVTTGVVSSVGRGGLGMNEIEDYIQTDASINPGNSGGPLVDLEGRVIGINTMIVGRSSGIGFAVSSELAQRVARQIIDDGRVRRPWIGVQFQELTPELASAFSMGNRGRAGALVADVVPDGPADRAGLKPGDVIVEVDGDRVGEARDLLRAILRRNIGAHVRLGIIREGQRRAVELQMSERPSDGEAQPESSANGAVARDDAPPTEGLALSALTPAQRQQVGSSGVVIVRLERGSDAHRAGLRPGDIILEADGERVSQPDDVVKALEDGHALLRLRRGEDAFYAVLQD